MNDKTVILIEKLAAKLGTTAEHLYGVLLHQAPISGTVDLFIAVVMIVVGVIAVRFAKDKTTDKIVEGRHIYAKWSVDGAGLAWTAITFYLIVSTFFVIGSVQGIVAAFLNPEYWALSHILGKL